MKPAAAQIYILIVAAIGMLPLRSRAVKLDMPTSTSSGYAVEWWVLAFAGAMVLIPLVVAYFVGRRSHRLASAT